MLQILKGLPEEYNSFKTTIRTRREPIQSNNLFLFFVLRQCILNRNIQSSVTEFNVAFSVAKRGNSLQNYNTSGNPSQNYNAGGNRAYMSNFKGHTGYFHGNRGRNFSNNRGGRRSGRQSNFQQYQANLVCQICNKENHSALECWHRLDTNFQPNFQLRYSASSPGTNNSGSKAFMTDTPSPSSS